MPVASSRGRQQFARDAKYEFANSNRGQGVEAEVRIDGAAMARPMEVTSDCHAVP
jgi:hypothetical protein